jgi:hypothetical protein
MECAHTKHQHDLVLVKILLGLTVGQEHDDQIIPAHGHDKSTSDPIWKRV